MAFSGVACILVFIFVCPSFLDLKRNLLEQKKRSYVYEITVVTILILLVGLRNKSVGVDSWNYADIIFRRYSNMSFERLRPELKLLDEPGFRLLNWFLGYKLGLGYPALFMICAVVSVAPIAVLIHRHSDIPELSWCFFLFFGFYSFCMSGIRQAMAIGITVLAFLQIPKKKPIRFVLLVFLAMMFHQTAIIFLPMYWLRYLKIDWKNIFLFLVAGVIIYFFKDIILAFLSEFSTNYYSKEQTGGFFQFLFLLLMLGSVIFMRTRFAERNPVNHIVFFMIASTTVIFLMLRVNPALFRLSYYYYIYIILFIPNQIKAIQSQALRWGVTGGYMFVGMYFFMTQILLQIAELKLENLSFFWQ